jgi:sulfane dehydrogenase subunit SoxC
MRPELMTIPSVPMKVKNGRRTTTPAHELTTFQTPSEKLFVVYHMGVPAMNADTWRLTVGGLVEKPLILTLVDLHTIPKIEVAAFHECAGNPLSPTLPVRRVGNVVWRGVQLKRVLEGAGIKSEARFVWSRGADSGIYARTGTYSDCYLKDLPLDKALCDEVLLATELNGEPLTEEHGAPVRLVVPGYYGTNSVKWLTAIELERTRAKSFYTTRLYNDRVVENGIERVQPVWAVAPHSIVVSPAAGQALALKLQQVWGWAWSADEISAVEISTDGGVSWTTAALDKRQGYCWQRFTYDWIPPAAGEYELACRATDQTGIMQPAHGTRNETFRIKVRIEGA